MPSLYDSIFDLYSKLSTLAYGYATQFLNYLVFGLQGLFSNPVVITYQSFLTIFSYALFICGIGFSVASWAISVNEGTGESIMVTFKNIFIGLFATLGFVTIPVNLLRFTAQCCELVITDLSTEVVSQRINNVIETDTTILGVVIFPLFTLATFYCCLRIFLSNIKRGGSLIILLTICPIHIFSIPRGHLEPFYSWCKQILALCLTTFVQNFLVSLSFLIIGSSKEVTVINIITSLGVSLASLEAPKFMDRLGMDTSIQKGEITRVVGGFTSLVSTIAR